MLELCIVSNNNFPVTPIACPVSLDVTIGEHATLTRKRTLHNIRASYAM
jgi:hypothetical protein